MEQNAFERLLQRIAVNAADYRAGDAARPHRPDISYEEALARFDRFRHASGDTPTAEMRRTLQRAMQDDAAVFRTGETLRNGTRRVHELYDSLSDIRVSDRSMIWNSDLVETLEYQNLDDLPAFAGQNTTTEFLCRWIYEALGRQLAPRQDARLRVTLVESPNAWAAYEGSL